ncbi:MAG: serine acetyltransferase [Dehalococcoidia bacterium]|nr:serine acetyltransferase [Dehalococcoidia bacterium]
MFENVQADVRAGLVWHESRLARRLFGRTGAAVSAALLSIEIEAVLIYRFQAWAQRAGIPLIPNVCQRLTMMLAGVSIGNFTTIGPGLRINHGHVIIDGFTTIGANCSIAPFVTIGLDAGGPDTSFEGPKISDNVFIGTGAKILGGVRIGTGARIGANAVVITDVPEHCTAVGVPAQVLPHETPSDRL